MLTRRQLTRACPPCTSAAADFELRVPKYIQRSLRRHAAAAYPFLAAELGLLLAERSDDDSDVSSSDSDSDGGGGGGQSGEDEGAAALAPPPVRCPAVLAGAVLACMPA